MNDKCMSNEEYIRQIIDIISGIGDSWILWQIHRFCVNILG